MSTIWENFAAFWASYGPWIGAAIIPTIITGLTMSPKTAKAGPWVQKVWDGIKMVMDFLSVLTHKDKPGTFQLPLKADKVIEKVNDKIEEKKEEKKEEEEKKTGGGTGVLVFVFVAILGSQQGCAWWSKNGGDVKEAAFNCAVEAAQDKARPLVLTMVGVLTGASDDTWKKQTKVLAKEFGKDAVACATRTALERITNPVQSEEDPELMKATAMARARVLEIEEGWKYAE